MSSHDKSFLSMLDAAYKKGVHVQDSDRTPEQKIKNVTVLYHSGIQFFLPVHLNSKKMVWKNNRLIPVREETLNIWAHKQRKTRAQKRRAYDFAVQTGTWKMPERDSNQMLIVLDIDNWENTPNHIRHTLENNPTFVVQTMRGFHFYYWVPRIFNKSGSNAGTADWLARGRIAVLTGADRTVLLNSTVATLGKNSAETLHKFATKSSTRATSTSGDSPMYPHWHINSTQNLGSNSVDDFSAIQGERNYRINATLYYYRELSDEKLMDMAVELADKCIPPYPRKEAESIAKSIIRYRHRFPVAGKKSLLQSGENIPYNGDFRYTRLGKYYRQAGEQFTRADYEAKLASDGWQRDSRGHIEATRTDITYNLELGEIKIVGKAPAGGNGGNRAIIYERVRDYRGNLDYILPGKFTHQHLRLSAMMWMLPDYEVAVVRETIRAYLNIKDDSTISRYSNELMNAERWGEPLIEKTVRPPYIFDQRLNPRNKNTTVWPLPNSEYRWLRANFVRHLASLYRRTVYYKKLLYSGKLPDKPPQDYSAEIAEKIEKLLARFTEKPKKEENEKDASGAKNDRLRDLPYRASPPKGSSEPCHVPCNDMAKNTTTPPEKTCRGCKKPQEEDDFCESCQKRRQEIDLKRKEPPQPEAYRTREDYCCFCGAFFISESDPLTGVCADCEAKQFKDSDPVRPVYCPACNAEGYTAHYTDWKPPEECASCGQRSHHWLNAPKPQEEDLPGYPVNYYLPIGISLFKMMDHLSKRLSAAKFRETFSELECQVWRETRGIIFKDVRCEGCGTVTKLSDPRVGDTIKKCRHCDIREQSGMTLPDEAQSILNFYNQRAPKDLKRLFKELFNKNTKFENDIDKAIENYGYDWVECALMTTARYKRTTKHVYNPLPFALKLLENWAAQLRINPKDEEACFYENLHYTLEQLDVRPEEEIMIVEYHKSIYRAYDLHIGKLTLIMAQVLTKARQDYPEWAILFAIKEAVRRDIRNWLYCEAILKRLEREDLL